MTDLKIMDLHSHTYYSNCGRDMPEVIIDAAVAGGIELFGITDHNYGIGDRKAEYSEKINALKAEYAGRIKLLCGIEILTTPGKYDIKDEEYSLFDYCLIEGVGSEKSLIKNEFFEFMEKIKIIKGIAHTDLFGYAESIGMEPERFFAKMAEDNIFWEMNVSFDSIHEYREHEYMLEFFKNEAQQKIIRDAGVYVSIGFDGHRTEDYLPERIRDYNKALFELNINTADKLF